LSFRRQEQLQPGLGLDFIIKDSVLNLAHADNVVNVSFVVITNATDKQIKLTV